MDIAEFLKKFEEKLYIQRYAQNTINSYINCLTKFLLAFEKYDLSLVNEKNIENYITHILKNESISDSYQKQLLGTIAKFFELFYNKKFNLKHLYPKRTKKSLPKYITQVEVKRLFDSISNQKHLCIVKLIYGSGLRVSEVINLKIEDIDSNNMQLRIADSKGRKDRYVIFSESLLKELRLYFTTYKPKVYLFEGQKAEKYSIASIQKVVKRAGKNGNISKIVTPHILRHSFATHLVENGTDIRYVQELLGHTSIKTTEIYTHITDSGKRKIKSPLDLL
ncbi:MAG: site-specific tyrosine recombinase/integron integrase [Cyclobacteriaceae bacterium]